MSEHIISDVADSCKIKATLLRYFNPIGAHDSAKIGELPIGKPDNLAPFITQTVTDLRDKLSVFGNGKNI
jgi:UDP-glucose 4-epimerase